MPQRMMVTVLLLLCACSARQGRVIHTIRETRGEDVTTIDHKIEVISPTDAANVTKIDAAPDGTIRVEFPPVYEPPKTDAVILATTTWSMWAAAACAFLAVASLLVRRWFPLMPSNVPVGLGALAGVLYVAPTVLDRYAGVFAALAAAWVAWIIYSWSHNRKLKQEPPDTVEKAPPPGPWHGGTGR